jgi:LysR family transcriptional regulator, cys regulon transcriptional activator
MNLQQLRFLAAVAQNGLNISAAAAKLRTSQPAISRQLKLLEDELGFQMFVRDGRALRRITPMGQQVIDHALRILHETRVIKRISDDVRDEASGTLSIGTTHTQARYVLPSVVQAFRAKYPEVDLHLHQGTSEQIAEMAQLDRIDIAIATGSQELFPRYVLLPCYQWHRCIVVPRGHELASAGQLTLQRLAEFPIVTYVFSFSGPSSLNKIFAAQGLTPQIALTARDADVIKTYVRLGLGIGVVADVAMDKAFDHDLVALDASHLFPAHTTWAGFMRGGLLRGYMYDFLQLLAPHLSRRVIESATGAASQDEVDALFSSIRLPAAART